MIILRILLLPFSLIYSLVTFVRNKFYDFGIFRSEKIDRPVISVGNITTGGTGKTPMVILLSGYLMDKGLKTGIISRGYKRESDELVIVSDGNKINNNIEQSGDELIMIASELMKEYKGKFSIAACSDRTEAAKHLTEKFHPDVIILDDGFQHRKIRRDLDIVMIDSHDFAKNRFMNSFTLPSGKLREGLSGLNRADLIIQNNKQESMRRLPELRQYRKDIFFMRYKSEYIIDNKNSKLDIKGRNAFVFSGIADDGSFIQMIKEAGINIKEIIKFSDHHKYTGSEIEFLKERHSDNSVFITTEKDFIKIRQFTDFTDMYPVYFLKIKAELDDSDNEFHKKLDELIKR